MAAPKSGYPLIEKPVPEAAALGKSANTINKFVVFSTNVSSAELPGFQAALALEDSDGLKLTS